MQDFFFLREEFDSLLQAPQRRGGVLNTDAKQVLYTSLSGIFEGGGFLFSNLELRTGYLGN